MATQNINIGVNVSDNGTAKKTVKNFQEIEAAATRAQKAAAGISAPPVKSTLASGGTSGSRKASEPSGSQQMMSSQEYGRGRGSMGATGASARDFANQAQGLGGVVRLYATYAANVFAVGAAFTALSNAMDTTNMIKGLDQLGIKSGVALGSLAERLVQATDGAISLREAMEATVKASSSGMNSDQILRVGKVAKQASLALGINMSDAISRLTRGVTKLEPELLDELGIFIRIDDVVKEYAKSTGKAANALTDFERRMAFTNATLEQGEKKFGAIDIESNPYSKLAAAVKTLTQNGLELINTFLTPAITLLASSPTSLGLVISGIALMMLKQAIPAFGQYREHLSALAEDSKNKLGKIYSEQQQILAEGDQMAAQRASVAFRASSSVLKEVKELQASAINFSNTAKTKWAELAAKNPFDLTAKELTALDNRANRLAKSNKNESDALKAHLADIRALRKQDADKQDAAQVEYEKRTSGIGSAQGRTEILTNRAVQQANAANIRSLVSEKQALYGASVAWKELNAEIAKSKAGMRTVDILDAQGNVIDKKVVPATNALQNGWTRVSGAVGIATGAISSFLAVAQPWIIIIGVAVQAFAVLDNMLSGNKKQLADFSSTVDRTDKALDMLKKTLADVSEKPFGQQFDSQSLLATSNAINEISGSVSRLIIDLNKVEKASNGWDKFIDLIKSAWSGDIKSKFADSMTATVVGALQELSGSPEAAAARKRLGELLQIDPQFTTDEFNKSVKKVVDNKPLLKQLSDVVLSMGVSFGSASEKSAALDASFTKSKEALKTLQGQFKLTDNVSLFGLTLVGQASAITKAFDDPRLAIAQLAATIKDTERLALFNEADRALILSYSDDINKLNKQFDEQDQKVKKSNKELEKQNEIIRDFNKSMGKSGDAVIPRGGLWESNIPEQIKKALDKRKEIQAELSKQESDLNATKIEVNALSSKFPQLAANQLERGAGFISAGITAAFEKGSGILQQAALSALGDLPGVAEIQRDIANRQIDSQNALLKSQLSLVQATKENSTVIAISNAKKDLETAQKTMAATGAVEGQEEAETARKKIADLEQVLKVVKLDPKQAVGAINEIVASAKAGNKEMAAQAEELMNYVSSVGGNLAQIQTNNQQKAANNLQAELKGLVEKNKIQQDSLSRDSKTQDLVLSKLSMQEKVNGSLTEAQLLEEKTAKDAKIKNDAQKQINDLTLKQNSLTTANNTLGEESKGFAERKLEIEKLTGDITATNQEKTGKLYDNQLQTVEKIYKRTLDRIQKEAELKNKITEIQRIQEDTAAIAPKARVAVAAETATFTPNYQRQLEAELAANDAINQAKRSSEDELKQYKVESARLAAEEVKLFESDASQEALDRAATAASLEDQRHQAALRRIQEAKNAEINKIDEVERYKQQREKFDADLDVLKSLDSAWQGYGTSLSNAYASLDSFKTLQNQNNATLEDSNKKLAALWERAEAGEDVYAALGKEQENNSRIVDKNIKSETAGAGKTISAVKSVFKEKTFAYKALDKIERAMHIYKMAMFIKENAMDAFNTAKSVANSAIRVGASIVEAGVDGVKAVVKAISSLPFPLNIAAGAATAAVVAGLLSQIGGKGPSMSGGGGAVENDGTGTVFGDKTAKSDTIAKSIEIVQDSDPVLMRNSSNMLKHLRSIDSNIAQFGVNLTRAINPGGYYNEQMGGINAQTGFKDYVLELIPGLNKIPGASIVNSIAKAIGTGVSTSIRGSGLQYGGQTLREATTTGLNANFFADVQKTYKAFGIKLGTSTSRENLGMDPDLQMALNRTFESIPGLVLSSAKALGFDQQAVSSRLQNYEIKAQTITFSGTDAEKRAQLEAAIGKEIDLIYKEAIPGMEAFIKANETYGTTVGRVAFGVDQAGASLERLGIQAINYNDIINKQGDVGAEIVRQSIVRQEGNQFIAEVIDSMGGAAEDIAETYVALDTMRDLVVDFGGSANFLSETAFRAAGGMGELSDAIAGFYDKFTSDAQKTADNNRKVGDLFASLNRAIPKTREEVLTLTNALTSTDPAAAARIMAATDKLDEFYNTIEEGAEKLKQAGESLRDQILNLVGSSADLLAASRAKTLAETPDELKALQRYVFALEDVKTAEANLTKAREAEVNKLKQQKSTTESTINSLNNYINSIKKFRESLLLSAQSPLTPAERYTESKRQFDAILATAMGTATTPEEQRTKDLALGQLEGAATAFLDASRVYNASSAQYTSDFSLVQRALSDTESALTVQLSTEEKSLAELEKQTGLLEDQITASKGIETGLLSVADALSQLAAAQATVETAAQDTGVSQSIEGFYQQYLGRSAEPQGMQDWTNKVLGGQRTLAEVEQGIAQSPEAAQYNANKLAAATTAATTSIEGFYQQYLNRASDEPGLKFWVERVMSGTKTLAEVEQGIAQSPEAKVGLLYRELLGRQGDREGISFWTNALLSGMSKEDLIKSMLSSAMSIEPSSLTQLGRDIYSGAVAAAVPGFARGTNFVPEDMLAQIHQGERIVPAADNAELMASIGNRNRTNEVLAQEIKKLNQEIKVLQKAVVDGAVINAQATDRNTVEISKTVKDTGLTASHAEAIRRRTQIV